MRNRFLSMVILVVALLLSAWGNVLAAALCPRLAQDHACCHRQLAHQSASHEAMDDMEMGDMQMEATAESKTDASALDQPIESCAHCMGHSQLAPGPISLGATDPAKRSVEKPAPLGTSALVSLPTSSVTTATQRGHSPPGESSPRHILINVFRI